MKKPTIIDTAFARALSLDTQANDAIGFIIKHAKLVVLNEQDKKSLVDLRLYTKTPATDLYQRVVESNKLSSFVFLDFSRFNDSIPEILTLNELTIDGKYVSSQVPPELQKTWVNLTPFLGKRFSATSPIVINDIPSVCNLVMRGMLSMSYNDSDSWLTTKLASFIIESYSMTITILLKRFYELDIMEYKLVQTLFAAYYAQLLGQHDSSLAVPPLLFRCPFLGSVPEITERMNMINPLRANDGESLLTPSEICKILVKVGPPRMHTFNENRLYTMFSTGGSDQQSMMLAIDYPPYWVYQLIKNVSGGKNSILSNIFKIVGMREKVMQFCQELNLSNTFIDRVNR